MGFDLLKRGCARQCGERNPEARARGRAVADLGERRESEAGPRRGVRSVAAKHKRSL